MYFIVGYVMYCKIYCKKIDFSKIVQLGEKRLVGFY